MQALARGAAARLTALQRLLPLLPAWAQPALGAASAGSPACVAAVQPPRAAHARALWGHAGALLPPAAAAAAAARLPAAAAGALPGAARGISVLVEHNNMDKALRRLKRKMIEEGITKELKERTHFQKPSQLRVLANKARDKRLAKRELKIKLNWILRKKARGF